MKPVFLALSLSLSLALPAALAADGTPIGRAPAAVPTDRSTDLWQALVSTSNGDTRLYLAACCKVCKKGKACGDSCISRSYTCHKAPGCACDG
ncbi:hypothetical protein [Celeribacter neptunius]|uniref:Uncharacterized protein n=1 Tax=Celeribacter neptunius TaxID=588602 RepID=A0A1I3JW15_9RHOB|nr:hypothetical protein [Celeribacter neptunius]SFI64346.1 hypothetical protein SAMN04487991_0483 [Celeribacter neptunius]